MTASSNRRDRDRRKREGVFYTPEPVARYMAATTLGAEIPTTDEFAAASSPRPRSLENSAENAQRNRHPLRIVDPACGDGALIWSAYLNLCEGPSQSCAAARLDVIRQQLFGVDLDRHSVEQLRQRFRDDLAAHVPPSALESVLSENFRCGNAVNGDGWEPHTATLDGTAASTAFHWSDHFPHVHRAGGFDIVIANPPYRRERGGKSDRTELESSPLGRSRGQARMDLWHYFFHRSLDLLRPGGLLTFIVNSYWTTSVAGRPLIARMLAETTPLEFVLLETAPIFTGVAGRHLIIRLRKGITSESCRISRWSDPIPSDVLAPELWCELAGNHELPHQSTGATSAFTWQTVERNELFADGKLNLEAPRAGHAVVRQRPTAQPDDQGQRLGDLFEVRQGIAENPPRVTRRQADADTALRNGEGVFVLNADEIAKLELSPLERSLLRPYYTAAEITRYGSVAPPDQWLLYLTRETAPDLRDMPRIEQHLARFRGLLEQRRETRLGKVAWWHLHWPREPRLFESPRILAVQMVKEPRFAYVESPTYVGFSTNVIVERSANDPASATHRLSLRALVAILNSKFAANWLTDHAKRRGVKLDITGDALKRFPLPQISVPTAEELDRLVLQRCNIQRDLTSSSTPDVRSQIELIEAAIEECVDRLMASEFA